MKKLVFLEIVTDIDGRLVSCIADVDYSGPWALACGKDKTGKKQEDAEVKKNDANQASDRGARDKAVNATTTATNDLAANPDLGVKGTQAANAEAAEETHAMYGSEGDQLKRHAAQTGWANDAGLFPQMDRITNERDQGVAMGRNNIAMRNATEALATRRMLPSLRFMPANMYAGSATAAGGQSAEMINKRMDVDNTMPFWQSMVLQGMQSAGQAATGAIKA